VTTFVEMAARPCQIRDSSGIHRKMEKRACDCLSCCVTFAVEIEKRREALILLKCVKKSDNFM